MFRISSFNRIAQKSLLVLMFCMSANAALANSFTTMFAQNNGFAGNTFDIEVGPNPIRITGWEVNLDNPGATETITIYWREGTSDGFTNSADGWILMGSDSGVVSAGSDNPSAVDIASPMLEAGQTYGIYVDLESYDGDTALRYTNSNGPTEFDAGDFTLTTFQGRRDGAFDSVGGINFRIWNGTIIYNVVNAEPVPLMDHWLPLGIAIFLLGMFGMTQLRIRTRR